MRTWQIAPIALILIGAVGCTSSGSGDPTSSPTSTLPTSSAVLTTPTAPTTSPSPTPKVATTGPNVRPGEKPPTLGSLGMSDTPAGSTAYAAFWIQALDWGYATTDSALAKTQYLKSCTDCAHFVRGEFDDVRAKHEHYVGGRLGVDKAAVVPSDGKYGATAIVDVVVTQMPIKLVAASGRVMNNVTSKTVTTFRTWLARVGNTWRVAAWKQAVVK